MKKRAFALVLALCMATSLAACKSEPEKELEQNATSSQTITEPERKGSGISLVMGQPIEQDDYVMTPIYCRTTGVVHCMHQDADYAMQATNEAYYQSDFLMKFTLKKRIEIGIYDVLRSELIRATAKNDIGEQFDTEYDSSSDDDMIEIMEESFSGRDRVNGWSLSEHDWDDYSPETHHPIDDYYIHYVAASTGDASSIDYVFHGDDKDYTYHFVFDQPEFATGILEKDVPVTTENGLTVTFMDKGYATEALLTSTGERSTYGEPKTYGDYFYYFAFKVENNTQREIDLEGYSSLAHAFLFNGTNYIDNSATLVATETADHTNIYPEWETYKQEMDTIKPGETGYLYAGFFIDDEYRDIPEFALDLTILEDVFHVEA